MTDIQQEKISQAQKERLSYIDFRLNFLGDVSRKDIMNRFGVKAAAATRDIALYKGYAHKNLKLDESTKIYTRTDDFEALFEYTASQVLTALAQGFGEDLVGTHKALIACESPAQLNKPSISVLSVLSRAIYQKKVVKITYRSIASGQTSREIVPFAMVDNGLRWHIRAFDRKRGKFSDFVITRIANPSISDSHIEENEVRDLDIQWNRIVELEITVHPRLPHPRTIEFDYGMKDGVLRINVRAAVAGYVLRLWNVDCSEDHNLEGNEIHLWLRNSAALYGVKEGVDSVENLFIAPGYQGS